jgi:hypothetical protein
MKTAHTVAIEALTAILTHRHRGEIQRLNGRFATSRAAWGIRGIKAHCGTGCMNDDEMLLGGCNDMFLTTSFVYAQYHITHGNGVILKQLYDAPLGLSESDDTQRL